MNSFRVWTKHEGPPNLVSAVTDDLDPNSDDFPLGQSIYDSPDNIPTIRFDRFKQRGIDRKKRYLKMPYAKEDIVRSGYLHSLDGDDEVASTVAPDSGAGSQRLDEHPLLCSNGAFWSSYGHLPYGNSRFSLDGSGRQAIDSSHPLCVASCWPPSGWFHWQRHRFNVVAFVWWCPLRGWCS